MADYCLFFYACGHPFGLINVGPGATERQAWNGFYDTEKQRLAAEERGVTSKLVDRATYREQYYELMRTGCDCVQPEPELEPGRGICSVCDREMRVLKNGTIGPHTTGRPDPYWSGHSPRCPGWGREPKGS